MIGAFLAFGVERSLAVLAVLGIPHDLLLAADRARRSRLLATAPPIQGIACHRGADRARLKE